jgi:hypothetical protein
LPSEPVSSGLFFKTTLASSKATIAVPRLKILKAASNFFQKKIQNCMKEKLARLDKFHDFKRADAGQMTKFIVSRSRPTEKA